MFSFQSFHLDYYFFNFQTATPVTDKSKKSTPTKRTVAKHKDKLDTPPATTTRKGRRTSARGNANINSICYDRKLNLNYTDILVRYLALS